MRGFGIVGLILLVGLGPSTVWAQGYSISANKVIVDSKDHWSNWFLPNSVEVTDGDIVTITDDGQVKPRFIRKNVNAALDASHFVHDEGGKSVRGGIRAAGSNLRDAANIIDDDPNTFWEPDLDDPLESWWVELDLGRLVSATRIVLRFADEGQGDPFLQFKVLTSTGDKPFRGSDALDFVLAGRTKKPNKDKRVFEYELSPSDRTSEEWTGRAFQYVRLVVTDSDGYKAELITKEQYESLDTDKRGAVEYIWKIAGEERLVGREEYEGLDPAERGAIRYYRREIPRLAELEVRSVGDNISLGIPNRGGSIDVIGTADVAKAFDGIYTTKWDAVVYKLVGTTPEWGLMTVDLGALFWIDAIRIITGRGQSTQLPFLYGYETKGSDGSKAPDGTFIWEPLSSKSRELISDGMYRIEDGFERRKIRFLEFKHIDIARRTRAYQGHSYLSVVSEFQIYGEGYVAQIEMTSGLIELGGSRNITSIEWVADTPPGTKVEIRTRTGNELREVKHYFKKGGAEITESAYYKLPGFARGEITSEFLPGSGWSSWSQAYSHPGDPIASPSPRKYLLIQVKLLSDDPNLFPSLDSITINFLGPVAKEAVGEVSPDRVDRAGTPEDFSFFIRPTFVPTNPGFDQVLIRALPPAKMELLGVSLGGEDDFLNFKTEDFLPDAEGVFRNALGDVLDVVRDQSDSLWIQLSKKVRIGDLDLIRVGFRSIVFLNGMVFEASIANSSIPNSWQRVDPGDATPLKPSRGTRVWVPLGNKIIGDVEIRPNPCTPNGDGINDEMVFNFTVFKINTDKTVKVTIYNLGGEVVRELSERRAVAAGRYSIVWSGEDESGRVVLPGIYLARISVDASARSAENTAVDWVVYVAY